MKSQHSFSQVPRADIPRSSFNLSHGLKTTFDADKLIPILVQDIIPGDTWNVKCNFFARLATPLHPILDNLYLETFFFFVPYRLLWVNFEKFHGAQDDPGDSIDFTMPSRNITPSTGTTADYFGIPTGFVSTVNDLPFRAYAKIYNDWFRDENMQDSITENTADAAIAASTYDLYTRGKKHDYFTSCLPAPQKGTAVALPLGTSAPIHSPQGGTNEISIFFDDNSRYRDLLPVTSDAIIEGAAEDTGLARLYADLSAATAATINDIRLAFQTQRLLERDARSGTRYVEALKAHWGVTSPDFRLQRAEFLGGGSSPINVTPVAQTSAAPTPIIDDKLGGLAGFGTVSGKHTFTQSFVEHGVLMGIVNARGDISYSQGLERQWSKSTRYDYFYPVLAQIGEQSVANKEIWVDGTANDELIFGYQERFAEYRYIPSKLSGLMRVGVTSSLEAWHLTENFASLPTLGNTFIKANTAAPLDRAIAVSTEPHFIADFFFDIKAARPLPLYGTPGNMDRF